MTNISSDLIYYIKKLDRIETMLCSLHSGCFSKLLNYVYRGVGGIRDPHKDGLAKVRRQPADPPCEDNRTKETLATILGCCWNLGAFILFYFLSERVLS